MNLKTFTLLSALIAVGAFSFVEAQTIGTNIKTNSKVEISLPIEKDDLLLFYGVTNDSKVNAELLELRKDFVEKFDNLKDEYKKSFNDITGNTDITPGIPEETVEEVKPVTPPATLKTSTNTKSANRTAVAPKTEKEATNNVTNTVKKYVIEDTKNAIITPIVNIVNDKATLKTEASSWFQKIKSWFGW